MLWSKQTTAAEVTRQRSGCWGLSHQVVVLGQVLAADINIGYEDMVNTRVSTMHNWH